MTLAKRLLLGTAAAFVATSGANAADLGLPVAPAVEYVQVCSIGAFTGFILPGGDVCFDISGYARGQVTWGEEIDPWGWDVGSTTFVDATIDARGYNTAAVEALLAQRAAVVAQQGVFLVETAGTTGTANTPTVVTVTPGTTGTAGTPTQVTVTPGTTGTANTPTLVEVVSLAFGSPAPANNLLPNPIVAGNAAEDPIFNVVTDFGADGVPGGAGADADTVVQTQAPDGAAAVAATGGGIVLEPGNEIDTPAVAAVDTQYLTGTPGAANVPSTVTVVDVVNGVPTVVTIPTVVAVTPGTPNTPTTPSGTSVDLGASLADVQAANPGTTVTQIVAPVLSVTEIPNDIILLTTVASEAAYAGANDAFTAGVAGFSVVGGSFIGIAGLDDIIAVDGDNDEADFLGNARVNFDARTMTEYGLLRGFIRFDGENGGAANVDRAFVQMNVGSLGFTAGLADSAFDPVFTGFGPGAANGLGLADQASNQFSVNAAVGNGVTVSLSIEDDDARTGTIASATASAFRLTATGPAHGLITFGTVETDGGQSIPDVIAAVRVDQAWGSAKLAAALHEINPAGSSVDSEFGYALSASAEFNLPIGVASTFGVTGIYAHGAQQFMGFSNEVGNTAIPYADAVLFTDIGGAQTLDLTTSYVIAAGFNFGVSNMLRLTLDGSYADVDHDFGELLDGNVFTVRGGLEYTPVNNLTLGAGVTYTASDFNTSQLRNAVDDDEWSARFRVTRSF